MANRRMIAKNISLSEKFADLATDTARMLYLMMMPHTDDYGRFDASPRTFKATVCPLLKVRVEKIQAALDDLARVGLIFLYEVDSHTYGKVCKFDEFQTFRSDRGRQALYPDIPVTTSDIPKATSDGLSKGKGRKEKLREEKGREEKVTDARAREAEQQQPVPPVGGAARLASFPATAGDRESLIRRLAAGEISDDQYREQLAALEAAS